jgi:DNA-directed RNA polymerase beta subunit
MADPTTPQTTGIKFIGDTISKDPGVLTSFDDYDTRRQQIFDYAKDAVQQRFPIANQRYTLEVADLKYDSDKPYTHKEQKEAILNNRSLTKKLQGKWVLKDNATNKVLEKSKLRTIVNVPYLTPRGTFIRNGSEQVLINQFRLVPSVFSRKADDGSIEAHVNVKQGTGTTFKISMDPKTAQFVILARNRKIKLYPVLQAMGVPDSLLEETWGKDILKRNREGTSTQAVHSAIQTLVPRHVRMQKTASTMVGPEAKDIELLKESFKKMELDPDSTETTLGNRHANVTPSLFLDTTSKLLNISRGKADTDDRDSMEFQRMYGPHNYIAERILKDPGNVLRSRLWKVTNQGNLSSIQSGILNKHVDSLFNTSGLNQMIEEINPLDAFDQAYRVSRMGEGGIASIDAVPEEARNVQPTYRGFVDPVKAPESLKIGVDMRMSQGTRYGSDGKVYQKFLNMRTGKREYVDSVSAARAVVGFPESLKFKGNYVPAMVKGKGIQYVPRKDIDYIMEEGSDLFSVTANMVPLASGIKAARMLMGSKMATQALPLIAREAPLVRTRVKGQDIYDYISPYVGRVSAEQPGVVKAVRKDRIEVQQADGTVKSYDLYDNFPFARKTYVRNIPKVKAGQRVPKGAVLATSNFTDDSGMAALGANLRVAYVPFKGLLHEDAIVISESAAKKLTSEHLYANKLKDEKGIDVSKDKYISLFPGKFTAEQYKTIGPEGTAKPGTIVRKGDPLILSARTQQPKPGTLGRRTTKDAVVTWDHHDTGVVTDVVKSKEGWKVYVRANSPAQIGDKMAGAYGNKGVIGRIVPDDKMPHDAKGKPFDILQNPVGVISRTNPAQLVEAALGKVARKTGKPYIIPGFTEDPDQSMIDYAMAELKKHNLSDTDDIYDPTTGKKIPKVFNGVSHFYKLQHTAEAKAGGKSFEGYTLEEQPSTGGDGAKRLGGMEVAALVSHGATEILKDAKLIRGQRNDDYWRDLKMGRTPVAPTESFIYKKFLASLAASGVNIKKDRNKVNIFAMTNEDAKGLTGAREIKTPDTFDPKQFKPIPGGLFDETLTGGAEGNRFAYIKLDDPMPNPVMEDSLRRILGLTKKKYMDYVTGREEYKGKTGGKAFAQMLADIDVNSETIKMVDEVKSTTGIKRDNATKRLRALQSMKEHKVKPDDFMMDRVPVLPPMFRPIVVTDEMNMASDSNILYRELLFARDDLREAKKALPDEYLSDIRERLYTNYKAVTGLGDPDNVELKEKRVGGLLRHIFSKGSPKTGMFQRRMVGGSVDLSGRAPITPNPSLKLNQVGLPENRAWTLYEPFVIRALVRKGYRATEAAKAVADRKKDAYDALREVVKERPVLINRAPTMHKYSIMAAYPILTKGDTLQIPPHIVGPFNADFDGDTMTLHVPVSEKAVTEAKNKMLPEKNLFGARDFKLLYKPGQEYVQGAYLATKQPVKGLPQVFETTADAIRAYKKGQIDIDAPIKIKDRS